MPDKSNAFKIEKFICVLFPINQKWVWEVKSIEEYSLLLYRKPLQVLILKPHSSDVIMEEVILKSYQPFPYWQMHRPSALCMALLHLEIVHLISKNQKIKLITFYQLIGTI